MAISSVSTELMDEIQRSWDNDPVIKDLISQLQVQGLPNSPYVWKDDQLSRKGRLVVGNDLTLQTKLIQLFHE